MTRTRIRLSAIFLALLAFTHIAPAADTPRQTIAKAIVEEDDEKKLALIGTLAGQTDPIIPQFLSAWKEDLIFVYKAEGDDAPKIPVLVTGEKDAEDKQATVRIDDGQPLKDAVGAPMRIVAADFDTAPHDSAVRTAMKAVLDLLALTDPAPAKRIAAINTFGMAQEPDKLPALQLLQKTEKNAKAKHALREAIALIQLKDENPQVQIAACQELASLGSIPSQDFLTALARESEADPAKAAVGKAAREALAKVAAHIRTVDILGTAFRGLSTGSVLLVVALGLAITFGLMGVINMAHGEIMAVGAYSTYVVQNIFGAGLALAPFGLKINLPGFSPNGVVSDWYFVVALPVAFLSAAFVGILLERGVIRFLYRRPLESLLATWGVSLVLQQLFRLTFGANNVQVYSPTFLFRELDGE